MEFHVKLYSFLFLQLCFTTNFAFELEFLLLREKFRTQFSVLYNATSYRNFYDPLCVVFFLVDISSNLDNMREEATNRHLGMTLRTASSSF